MATWQGTNGGLLAGIGGVNSNAPSVNDIGNTLQLIRQNNDIERSGANNVGLTALQGLSGIAGVFSRKSRLSGRKNFSRRTLMLMRLVIVVLCVSWLLNIQTRLNLFVKAWDSLMKTSAIPSAP